MAVVIVGSSKVKASTLTESLATYSKRGLLGPVLASSERLLSIVPGDGTGT